MSEPRDLRELVGEDVPEAELQRLARVDAVLRTLPAPVEVPESLAARVQAIPGEQPPFGRRRRLAAGLAAAAALAAGTFAIGLAVADGPDGPQPLEEIALSATPEAPGARMVLDVLPQDEAGNWAMVAEVSGLEPLPPDGYYELWLTREGDWASCGRFTVNANGWAAGVWFNAPYRFREWERWVVTRHEPGGDESEPLLDGPVVVPA